MQVVSQCQEEFSFDLPSVQLARRRKKFLDLYGLEVLPLYQYQLRSLDFVINRLFMKLFRTSDIQVVSQCQEEFSFDLPSVQLARRRKKFLDKLYHCHSV